MRRYIKCFGVLFICVVLLVTAAFGCSRAGIQFPDQVQRISEKPGGSAPLAGRKINEGVKLVAGNQVYIISFWPRPGRVAVYPDPGTGGDKIIIDKEKNLLYLYKGGELYRTYLVATGKDPAYTPEGNFKIARKIINKRGELKPQLGNYWMGLSVPYSRDNRAGMDSRAPEGSKYGIHGTDEPDSIGKHVSGGCIRMDNRQVEEVYALVEVGTPVEIR